MNQDQLKNIIEAAIMTAGRPVSIDYLLKLFSEDEQVERDAIREVLDLLAAECEPRGLELKQVASGYRYQAKQDLSPWLSRLSEERPVRYSRALLETLALIVYRQPVTRAEIEDVRGVAVSSSIIKTLLEREWVRVVGHRDVPGKPALYGTTRQFLDYFNLKSLSELPPLAEIRSLDSIQSELELKLEGIGEAGAAANTESIDDEKVTDGDADIVAEIAADQSVAALASSDEGSEQGEPIIVEVDDSSAEASDEYRDEAVLEVSPETRDVTAATALDQQKESDDPLAMKAG